jgi:hypothetical protein
MRCFIFRVYRLTPQGGLHIFTLTGNMTTSISTNQCILFFHQVPFPHMGNQGTVGTMRENRLVQGRTRSEKSHSPTRDSNL